jgi:hypothetical protein
MYNKETRFMRLGEENILKIMTKLNPVTGARRMKNKLENKVNILEILETFSGH